MSFKIYNEFKLCDYTPYYSQKEKSFYTIPDSPSDYSIMVGDSCIYIDVSGIDDVLCSINGYSDNSSWIDKKLVLPNYRDATVSFNEKHDIIKGTGIIYKMNDDVFFDISKNIICIGEPESSKNERSVSIRFNTNTILTFLEKSLVAIWIIPIWN